VWEEFSHQIETLLHELSVLSMTTGRGLEPGTALDLSNYMFHLVIAFFLTLIFFMVASRKVSLVPKGISNVAEALVEFVRDLCTDTIGPEGKKYFPFIGTLFFFILFNNLWGLIPGMKPGTGTISVTFAWAMLVFFFFWFEGIRKNGVMGYLGSMAPSGAPPGIKQFVWLLEMLSNFMRPITLAVRLMANMYAGHLVLGVFAAFAAIFGAQAIEMAHGALSSATSALGFILVLALLVALYGFELFVAFIQAYVFAILTANYIALSIHTDH
jgi:F-type H+-transporting ATPase subunit a